MSERIVVGWNGTAEADHALDCAARQASRDDSELTVLHVCEVASVASRYLVELRRLAASALESRVAELQVNDPALRVRGELVTGEPSARLAAEVAGGAIVVIGAPATRMGPRSVHTRLASIGPRLIVVPLEVQRARGRRGLRACTPARPVRFA